ncbi:tRNA pseudouridine(55) synthase TruB [Nitratireductor sp. CH_MIT9313-5]|jgi:tRNA pseudouridine55 synthase|uniref:tRNA pseudouridine(55) synthase TruB n=1 Tax=Nitratireductor sp. CH_MIT9313-5 TaxID=3107764 RepID=UPI00300BD3F9
MARRGKKKGRPVSGWIVLDKPVKFGSTDAVSKVKWLFQAQKAGHAGTLDPLASGMLPIALGEATKTVPFVMEGAKVYRFTVAWGEERTTDDLEGPVVKTSDKRPSVEEIEAVLPKYTGLIMQVPPQFSAVKIGGERAYDLAREGEEVEIAAREVEIGRLELIKAEADRAEFEIDCGKGTYVRSLARDIGRDLGCYGYIAELRRTEVYPFEPAQMVSLETLIEAEEAAEDENARFEAIDPYVMDTAAALGGLPEIQLSDDAAHRIRMGNPVIVRGRDAPVEAPEAWASARGKLVAIGFVEAGMFKPKRVFADT